MQASLERNCPICSGEFSNYIPYPGSGPSTKIPSLQSIALCQRCGAGTALPRPAQAELDEFYSSGSYWNGATGEGSTSALQRAHESSQAGIRLRLCLQYLPINTPLTVADIGAGHGFIGKEIARIGLTTMRYDYVEPDESAGENVGSLGLPFPARRLGSVKELRNDFNLLFLNHVIEHVSDPLDFLQDVLSHATPGAIIYLETPNSDYRFKSDVFPHTFFFTERAFAIIAKHLSVDTLCCQPFGCWPSPRSTVRGLTQRCASRLYAASVVAGLARVPEILDRFIWRYDQTGHESGIWLRWIFRTNHGRGTKS